MEVIGSAIGKAVNYLMTIGLNDFIDIVIVAYLIYKAIWFVRTTNSYSLAKGLAIFLVVLWISEIFGLTMINFILRKAVELGLIAVLILFQPELRRLLERVGNSFGSGKFAPETEMDAAIMQTVSACQDMSRSRTGALIIFERAVSLENIMSLGTPINANTTAELLKNLFYNKAPLHDGAVVIRNARIASAGCVLPLTQSRNLSKDLGMRHRAGIGLSEQSDALVIIVSEETGAISVAINGKLKRHLPPEELDRLMRSELISDEDDDKKPTVVRYILKYFEGSRNEEHKSDEKDI